MPNINEFKPGIMKTPALYESADQVLTANKAQYDAWIANGKNETEALELTFKEVLDSPRTADQDIELIHQAKKKGY